MSEPFDPYHLWLGIPPKDQPPTHYRLLGLEQFEANPDVIANAADQRMAHIRSFQMGKHSARSQMILNEIAAARVCLLNADKKRAYDELLREQAAALPPVSLSEAAPEITPVDEGIVDIFKFESPRPRSSVRPRIEKHKKASHIQVAVAVLTLGVIAVGAIVVVSNNLSGSREQKYKSPRSVASARPTKPPAPKPRTTPLAEPPMTPIPAAPTPPITSPPPRPKDTSSEPPTAPSVEPPAPPLERFPAGDGKKSLGDLSSGKNIGHKEKERTDRELGKAREEDSKKGQSEKEATVATPKEAKPAAVSFPRGIIDITKYHGHIPGGKVVHTIGVPGNRTIWSGWRFAVSLTPDDKTLVMSRFDGDHWLLSYDYETGRFGNVFEKPNGQEGVVCHTISKHECDKCYVGFNSGVVCEYSITTGKILRSIYLTGYVDEVQLTRNDGQLFIAGTPPTIWDLKTNKISMIADSDANTLALSPNENILAVGFATGMVCLYKRNYPKPVLVFPALGKSVLSVCFSNGGNFLAVATADPNTLCVYYLTAANKLKERTKVVGFNNGYVKNIQFIADDSLLFAFTATGKLGGQPCYVFDSKTMLPICQMTNWGGSSNGIITSDGKYVIPAICRRANKYEVPDRSTIIKTIEEMRKIP